MDLIAVILVLVAAVLHATWNAVVKIDTDRLMTMAVMIGTTGILAPLLLLFGPAPTQESWPYILLSALLNNVYFLFLIEAYRFGDLSLVYPVARGSSPLLVAAGAYWFAGEHLDVMELTGVIVISGGIISLVWSADVYLGGERRAVAFSLLTGLMIATYTIIDGIGEAILAFISRFDLQFRSAFVVGIEIPFFNDGFNRFAFAIVGQS